MSVFTQTEKKENWKWKEKILKLMGRKCERSNKSIENVSHLYSANCKLNRLRRNIVSVYESASLKIFPFSLNFHSIFFKFLFILHPRMLRCRSMCLICLIILADSSSHFHLSFHEWKSLQISSKLQQIIWFERLSMEIQWMKDQ